MKKIALIFLTLILVGFLIFKYSHVPSSQEVKPEIVSSVAVVPSVPAPTVIPEENMAVEIQWKKDFQKIQDEEARLRAQNKLAELSKFQSLGYTCEIVETEHRVIKNKKEWEALLHRMGIQTATGLFPNINFRSTMIAAVFSGEQSFTEKLILIDSQEFQKTAQGKKLVIGYRRAFAPKGSSISTIMVQPYHLKIFPSYKGAIEFKEVL